MAAHPPIATQTTLEILARYDLANPGAGADLFLACAASLGRTLALNSVEAKFVGKSLTRGPTLRYFLTALDKWEQPLAVSGSSAAECLAEAAASYSPSPLPTSSFDNQPF